MSVVFACSEGKPLWSFEDITTKCHDIRSAAELTDFLVKVLDLFDSKFQGSDIRGCWARVASKWAISCSSRHYAGRSFQVLRGLAVEFSWTVLSDILSRLAESIGDNNEDVQVVNIEILYETDTQYNRWFYKSTKRRDLHEQAKTCSIHFTNVYVYKKNGHT